jgi:hypothetical protein
MASQVNWRCRKTVNSQVSWIIIVVGQWATKCAGHSCSQISLAFLFSVSASVCSFWCWIHAGSEGHYQRRNAWIIRWSTRRNEENKWTKIHKIHWESHTIFSLHQSSPHSSLFLPFLLP